MKNTESVSGGLLRLAKYEIFRDKKRELIDYIGEQLRIWGSYQDIPEDIAGFIDRQFVTLGIFGKKIDAISIEEGLALGSDNENPPLQH